MSNNACKNVGKGHLKPDPAHDGHGQGYGYGHCDEEEPPVDPPTCDTCPPVDPPPVDPPPVDPPTCEELGTCPPIPEAVTPVPIGGLPILIALVGGFLALKLRGQGK